MSPSLRAPKLWEIKGSCPETLPHDLLSLHKVSCGQIWTQTAKIEQNCSIFPSLLKGLNVTIVESSTTYGKINGPVQKLFSMICFHLNKVSCGQIWTQTAKIEQHCSIFPSLLKGLKYHHCWELRNLWQFKGSCPETRLNDLLSFT